MAQYIDKDALIAEIEKEQRKLNLDSPHGIGGFVELARLKDTINTLNTLEVKDADLEEEELTEFEQEYKKLYTEGYDDGQAGSKPLSDKVLKECAKELLDLARKELQPEFDKEMDKMLAETDKVVYQK